MLNIFEAYVYGQSQTQQKASKVKKKTKQELMKMDQNEMFMELIRDITNELDVNVLCHKLLVNVGYMTHCETASLFLRRGDQRNRYLAAKLFDVTETSTLAQTLQPDDKSIKIPFGVGIAGSVAATKEPINIPDAYADSRFNRDVDKKTGKRTRNILCMPLLDSDGEVLGVAQIMNKTNGDFFTKADEKIFSNYLAFCSIGITNAQLFELSTTETKQNQLLLKLAQGVFGEHRSLERLVMRILMDAQELIRCERCLVYLIKKNSYGKIELARGYVMDVNVPKKIVSLSQSDLTKGRASFFATEAATSGEPFVIEDALSDPNYMKEIIDNDGFAMKSVLTVPIFNGEGDTVGVVQMLNKGEGKPFSDLDVNTVKTFAIFCGLGMHHCELFGDVRKLIARHESAMDVLLYHSSATPEEIDRLDNSQIGTAKSFKVYDYMFLDLDIPDSIDLCKCVLRMFLELNILSSFAIPYRVLCKWILTIRKNHRRSVGHDFRHAVGTTQSIFVLLTKGKFVKFFDDLTKFCLIIAALSHDLDHRGAEEYNLAVGDTPYTMLYNSSVTQRHHYDRLHQILKDPGALLKEHADCRQKSSEFRDIREFNIKLTTCNILADTDQVKAMQMIEECIVATDFSVMEEIRKQFKVLVEDKNTTWTETKPNYLLRCMLLGAADMSNVYKPWEVQPRLIHLSVDYCEYVQQQTDNEEEDRAKVSVAFKTVQKRNEEMSKYHLDYVNKVCLEQYQLLAKLESAINPVVKQLYKNVINWRKQEEERTDAQADTVADEKDTWKMRIKRRLSTFSRKSETEADTLPDLTRRYPAEGRKSQGARASHGLFMDEKRKSNIPKKKEDDEKQSTVKI